MEWGTPVKWGWFLLFSRSGGHKTKEAYPTRPGSPTPCKQGLSRTKQRCSRAKQRQGNDKKHAARANLFFANLWDTSTRRSHSAQITSPRVVRKSCLIHRFLSPLLHEQIQIHRRYSILEKTCSCNRIKLNYQATKKKIESTRKHRRLGSKFCDRLHHNYVTCSKTKKIY